MWKILIGNITRSRRKIALFKLLNFPTSIIDKKQDLNLEKYI